VEPRNHETNRSHDADAKPKGTLADCRPRGLFDSFPLIIGLVVRVQPFHRREVSHFYPDQLAPSTECAMRS
jgi:hypothetical protein